MAAPVFIVCLREPASTSDYREDPYWEVGSFGCTGCHRSNLLHPAARHIPDGARLAFAQGGPQGAKLVFLTPPVQVIRRLDSLDVKWKPQMPFRYTDAPLLIDHQGNTSFPALKSYISASASKNWRHKLSSKCRSFAHPLPVSVAAELKSKFDSARVRATPVMLAKTYLDAIPEWVSWEVRSKAEHPWKPQDRKEAYYNNYSEVITKPRTCGKKHC